MVVQRSMQNCVGGEANRPSRAGYEYCNTMVANVRHVRTYQRGCPSPQCQPALGATLQRHAGDYEPPHQVRALRCDGQRYAASKAESNL